MRRVASRASTGPPSSTTLRTLAVRSHSGPRLQLSPSALAFTSSVSFSASARRPSSAAAPKGAPWTTHQEPGSSARSSSLPARDELRLGQEEGRRSNGAGLLPAKASHAEARRGSGKVRRAKGSPAVPRYANKRTQDGPGVHSPVAHREKKPDSFTTSVRHVKRVGVKEHRAAHTSESSKRNWSQKRKTGFASRKNFDKRTGPQYGPGSESRSHSYPNRLEFKNLLPYTSLAGHGLGLSASSEHPHFSQLIEDIRNQTSEQSRTGVAPASTLQKRVDPLQAHEEASSPAQVEPLLPSPAAFTGPERRPNDICEWERLATYMKSFYSPAAAWESMALLRDYDRHFLAQPEADELRDAFLHAAVGDDVRLDEFVQVVRALEEHHDFLWVDLYGNVMYNLLDGAELDRVLFWHSRLYSSFEPSQDVFAALLSHFVVDSSPVMQEKLVKLHASSTGSRLYDAIIPRLFDWGQSRLARDWRKRLLSVGDCPTTQASAPFLRFLAAYYPLLKLAASEKDLLEPSSKHQAPVVRTKSESELEEIKRLTQGDHLVAKWFASAWTTVDFAIESAHRIGVKILGPLALQALGLREPGARTLAKRVKQLKTLGVEIAPTTYCKVIVHFATCNQDQLLEDLLACDVHPDEFEDVQTLRMLADAAERRGDISQERLMREAEEAVQTVCTEGTHEGSADMHHAGNVLDTGLSAARDQAEELLAMTFERLSYHPVQWSTEGRENGLAKLRQAISALRHASANDVAIPLEYPKRLLYNLGRFGELSLLETLCLEIAQMYSPSQARLIPVHPSDLPSHVETNNSHADDNGGVNGLEMWQRSVEAGSSERLDLGYIPSDLPFSHRQHPIQLIFHQRLQRNIMRWGFDYALKIKHPVAGHIDRRASVKNLSWRSDQISEQGVGRGLQLLAKLRDLGVSIDVQVIRSELLRRIIAAEFPGRDRAPWIDSQELAISHMMRMTDSIWGSGLFESEQQMQRMVDERREKAHKHYWKNWLFGERQQKSQRKPRK